MYTDKNYKTKKELKADVQAGKTVTVYQPGPFEGTKTGRVCIEGPHYPEPHRWYATVEIADGAITKFIS